MDFSFSDLNINSVVIDNVAMLPSIENLLGFEARAAFTVNSASAVFKEDVDIVPVIIGDMLSYVPWRGDNNMPFYILQEHPYLLVCNTLQPSLTLYNKKNPMNSFHKENRIKAKRQDL